MRKPTLSGAIHKDAYDEIIFSGVKDHSGSIQEVIAEDPNKEVLTSDVFASMYKANPTLKEDAQGLSKNLMQTMMALPEFQQLRSSTKFDDIASAFGTMKLAPGVIEGYTKVQEELEKRQKENKGKSQKKPGNQGEHQNSGEPGEGQGDHQGNAPEGQGEEPLDDSLQDIMRQCLRQSLQEAQEEVDEWQGLVSSWGIDQGELQKMPLGKKMELAERLKDSKKFQKLADMMGRFRNVVQAQVATTFTHGVDEIVDITQGDDLMRMLPSELLKLKKTPTLFMKDMIEKSLQVYNLRGVENLGKGPIICLLDVSGSMEGERETWAKAVILALMFLAEKQKRAFGIITFEAGVRWTKFYPVEQKPTIEEKLEIASLQSDGGGTDFYKPLMRAFNMRRANQTKLNPADIVMITDGDSDLDKKQLEKILENKKETQMRIQSINIGGSLKTLEKFSDSVASIEPNGDVSNVRNLVTKVASS
jgi:uncharacterized protein with von Willebrand factor type A (vWA) domain